MILKPEQKNMLIGLMKISAEKGNLANAAIVLEDSNIIASAESLVASDNDATAHSERMLVSEVCRSKGNNFTPGLHIVTVVESCTMCLSACSQAGYASSNFIIPAKPYVKKFPWVTDGIALEEKEKLAKNFSEKVELNHLKEYESEFRAIFDEAMKNLFIA